MAMKNEIGVIHGLRGGEDIFAKVADFGLNVCQLVSWSENMWTEERAQQVVNDSKKSGVRITSLWAGWPGPKTWDFMDGPNTLGLVPTAYRAQRVETLERAGDFAKQINVPAVITHLGYIPENASDSLFYETVAAVRHLANYYKKLGIEFWFETGQETPVTMLRLIKCVGTDNLGINLDPANLILYGKANPIDALDVFGQYVRNIHAKDGLYPTDPMKLGKEVKVGEGKVRFPEFVRRLNEIGYKGEFIIEREIKGEQQSKDIATTVEYLRNLLKET